MNISKFYCILILLKYLLSHYLQNIIHTLLIKVYSFKYMKSSSTKFNPNNMIQESRKNYGYVSGFNYIHLRVNSPKACDLNSRRRPRFYLTLSQIHTRVNLPKACDPRSRTRPRFCLTLNQIHTRVNHND